MLVIEQCGPYYKGWIDGIPVVHVLNSDDIKKLEEYQVGEECALFTSKKQLKKVAKHV